MTAPTILDPVAAYAAAVRRHLLDLGPEVIDDLTGGLEADLAESLADALGGAAPTDAGSADAVVLTDADLTSRFGSPAAYAAELRESAGLPPAGTPVRKPSLRDRGAALLGRWNRALNALPGWPPLRDFVVALKPLWWLLRGWTLAVVVTIPLQVFIGGTVRSMLAPQTIFAWLLILAGVVVSVQLGRGAWVLTGRLGKVWRVAAGLLIPCSLVVVISANDEIGQAYSQRWWDRYGPVQTQSAIDAAFAGDTSGILVGGQRARNLFVYGPDGALIDGAQIVDQAGRPVVLANGGDWWTDGLTGHVYVPRLDEAGREVRNSFPVPVWSWTNDEYDIDDEGNMLIPEGESATTPRPPAQSLVPLWTVPEDTATDAPTPDADETTDATPSPTPTPTD